MGSCIFQLHFVFVQAFRCSYNGCIKLKSCTEIQCFKCFKGMKEAVAPHHNTMVFQNGNITAFFKFPGDLIPQVLAARQSVIGNGNLPTAYVSIGKQSGIGDLPHNTERHQCRRMCMKYCFKVRSCPINMLMERIFT